MKKMPTLYKREFDNNHNCKIVGTHPIEGMEWVEAGLGVPTEKIDGACCAIIYGRL